MSFPDITRKNKDKTEIAEKNTKYSNVPKHAM